MKMLSVILPSYNEEKNIKLAYETLTSLLKENNIIYEIIFVNDGSKDNTWKEIRNISTDEHIKGVCFSRNFGKESAIYAGLYLAKGDAAVVMDCDMQHPPDTIIKMYELWKQGYDVVEGIKLDRGSESGIHKFAANAFYKLISKATGIDMSNTSDFKLLDRKVIDALLSLPERNSFFRALSSWVGFKATSVGFEVQERANGTSKWSTKALIKYALSNISSFTSLPLYIVTFSGMVVFIFGLLLGLQTLIRYLMGNSVEGFTTVILLLLIIGSIIMLSLGIIGYYISKIYDEVKKRPKYIISDIVE